MPYARAAMEPLARISQPSGSVPARPEARTGSHFAHIPVVCSVRSSSFVGTSRS